MKTSKEILDFMDTQAYRPLTLEELINHFLIDDVQGIKDFSKILSEMEQKGAIILTRKMRYGSTKRMNLVVGRIQGNDKGFAFLIPDDVNQRDIYIKSDDMNGAIHNDRVIVRLYKALEANKKPEGEVIRILVRMNTTMVGTFELSKNLGFVLPDDSRISQDFLINKSDFNGAKNGDKVVIEVTRWPEKRRSPEGKIIEIIGKKGEPGVDILSIVRKYQLPEEFPQAVLAKAEKISLTITPQEAQGRKDLRSLPLITIDGEDTKDIDDAVSLEILESGQYRLGVHIADVGHYVKEGSILDIEALKRATSVYLVDRVIPMLPQRLSNGICSLNAGEDRLALSCFMNITQNGEVENHEIFESIIRVKERMTYTNVTKVLLGEDQTLLSKYRGFVEILNKMAELCLILKNKRLSRGTIDFDFPESKVILDKQGRPLEIAWRERSLSDQIIEEFMICANETVAEHYHRLDIPFLYRVHEKPELEDVTDLNNFLGIFGLYVKINNGKVDSKAYQTVLKNVVGKPEERAIITVMLRSMKHARYAVETLGHFGLASKYYSHFTSPIRRYPDLAIHRIIKEIIQKGDKLDDERLEELKGKMNEYAKQSSLQEKIAEDAERESVDLKKVEYMKQFEGQNFTGIISGVTSFGLFVELENSVEGLIHVSSMMDDYYIFEEKSLSLKGEHTKKVYQLGQRVRIQIAKVKLEERKIEMEFAEEL
jgi:ribonuclease R